jgi:hypothetical protein
MFVTKLKVSTMISRLSNLLLRAVIVSEPIDIVFLYFHSFSIEQQFFFVPPVIAEKKRKAQELKEHRKKQKATTSQEGSTQQTLPDDEEVSPEHVVKITAYIDVAITRPAATGRKKGSVSECLQRGPFIFYNNTDFVAFQTMVAKTLPCPPASLNWAQIKWKFDMPANSRAKNLSDNIGFEAMIGSMLERKKNFVIRIITPPPAKPEIVCFAPLFPPSYAPHHVQPWETGEDDHIPEDKDLFDSIESIANGNSMNLPKTQIVRVVSTLLIKFLTMI